jgi:predicted methyltransferase
VPTRLGTTRAHDSLSEYAETNGGFDFVKHMDQPKEPEISLARTETGEMTLLIDGHQAMQAWEEPLMKRSAELLCEGISGTFLECGLGFAISAVEIAKQPTVEKHIVIERYSEVIEQVKAGELALPEKLEIIHDDFFDYIDTIDSGSIAGIMLDPWVPKSIRDDADWWDDLMRNGIRRVLTPGGRFVSFFSIEPTIEPRFEPYFSKVVIERHTYSAYQTTSYMNGSVLGNAYLQCFVKEG